MQATIRHNLTNHSHGFITGAQVHNAFKAITRKEMLAASRRHKKTISKARHQRRPVMSEFINAEVDISSQIKFDGQDLTEEEMECMFLACNPQKRKRPPTRAEPLLPFLQ